MPDSCQDRPSYTAGDIRDAVCIHTNRVEDACIDRDCLEDLRVYLTQDSQTALDAATGVRARSAELLYVYIDVAPVSYHRGHYSVDLTYYYRIICDATVNGLRPTTLYGLSSFSKRIVLCGGTGCAKVFSSRFDIPFNNGCPVPEAVVEVVDPMLLAAKVQEVCACCPADPVLADIPPRISELFDGQLVVNGETKRLYVSLGQFSTVRLERETQLTVPVFDYAVPSKECCDEPGCEETPCETFSRIDFPVDAFFPCRRSHPAQEASCGSESPAAPIQPRNPARSGG